MISIAGEVGLRKYEVSRGHRQEIIALDDTSGDLKFGGGGGI